MIKLKKDADSLSLETGYLCLDFANTAEWHASDQPIEELTSFAELVAWAQQVGLLAEAEAQQLLEQAAGQPTQAEMLLEQAISLREAIYRIFSAMAGEGRPDPADLAILNEAFSEAMGHLRVVQTEAGPDWGWAVDEAALDQMLWPVARSAAELLTSGEVDRVGQCADNRGCGWLFFDTSRNRSRRWCDMKGCGNRAKVRRHYRRRQKTSTTRS